MPLDSQVGRMMNQYGREVVRVNHLATQASVKSSKMIGTYGHHGSVSSKTVYLQSALENKLRQNLGLSGSGSCDLTWTHWDIPLGPQVCALIPSKRHTKGSDRFGLPTPQAMDAKGYSTALQHKYRKTGHLKHWTHGTALAIHSRSGKSSWPKPEFTEWMMGFPRSWTCARHSAATVMLSSRRSRHNL